MSDFHFIMIILDTSERGEINEFVSQLNRANDWIEFRQRSWLVWTKQNSKTWYGRLKPILKEGDNVFVCGVNIEDRGGWMPKAFWDFVRAKSG